MTERTHSSMSEIGAAELRKPTSRVDKQGWENIVLHSELPQHLNVMLIHRQLTIWTPTIGQLKVTALDEKTMLSKPTWAHSSPDYHRSARSGRQRRRDTQHAETPHTTVVSELRQYPIATNSSAPFLHLPGHVPLHSFKMVLPQRRQ